MTSAIPTPGDPSAQSARRRWWIPVVVWVGIVGTVVGAGSIAVQRIRSDLQRDLVWYPHRGSIPSDRYTRSERWFPLTLPIFLHWTSHPTGSTRFGYGAEQLVQRGQPYSTWWLEHLLRQNPEPGYDQTGLSAVLGGYNLELQEFVEPDWAVVGLENPAEATRITELAIRHVDPSRSEWNQTNLTILQRLLQTDYPQHQRVWSVLLPAIEAADPTKAQLLMGLIPTYEDGIPWEWQLHVARLREQLASLDQVHEGTRLSVWDAVDQIQGLENPSLAEIRALTQQWDPDSLAFLISGLMGPPQPHPVVVSYVAEIASDPDHPQQVMAAVELLLKRDPRGEELLATVVEGDLTQLHTIWDELLLLQLAEAFPTSRFTRAARAYGEIRGGTYFGNAYYDEETGERIPRPYAPAEEERRWRQWLAEYADHPGADDAAFWLGRTLEWQGRQAEALVHYADWLVDPVGDRDMTYQIRRQFLFLLDVGVEPDDLATVVQTQSAHALEPLFRYGLAVRQARQHHYGEALRLSQDLSLNQVISTTPGWEWQRWYGDWQQQISAFDTQLADQQQRWQDLQRWQQLRNSQERLNLARHWASWTGWRNGYLVLFDGFRNGGLGWGGWRDPVAHSQEIDQARPALQLANHNAQAVMLLEPLIEDTSTPARLVEQALYLQISALYRQYASYPPSETFAMVPLNGWGDPDPSLYEVIPPDWIQAADPYYDIYKTQQEQSAWYIRHIIRITSTLLEDFPRSRYGDDALMVVYELTQDPEYLKELLQRFPEGDRSEEARVLLYVFHGWDPATKNPSGLAQSGVREHNH
ncbi:MAG: tol-pal system YbgF family protein [Cyanophyceae cyanobacterium]